MDTVTHPPGAAVVIPPPGGGGVDHIGWGAPDGFRVTLSTPGGEVEL